jgi:hypothetical protein
MNETCELVQRLEEKPQLPKGDGELLSGSGVMSCPLASADILCSRRFPASSFGPAYTAIWHRDPSRARRSWLAGVNGCPIAPWRPMASPELV